MVTEKLAHGFQRGQNRNDWEKINQLEQRLLSSPKTQSRKSSKRYVEEELKIIFQQFKNRVLYVDNPDGKLKITDIFVLSNYKDDRYDTSVKRIGIYQINKKKCCVDTVGIMPIIIEPHLIDRIIQKSGKVDYKKISKIIHPFVFKLNDIIEKNNGNKKRLTIYTENGVFYGSINNFYDKNNDDILILHTFIDKSVLMNKKREIYEMLDFSKQNKDHIYVR